MADETISARLIIQDEATPQLNQVEKATEKWAQTTTKSVAKAKKELDDSTKSVLNLKNAFVVLAAAWAAKRVFSAIITSTDEMQAKWIAYKKEIMDSGPTAEMNKLGDAFGTVAPRAETVGNVMTFAIARVTEAVKGWGLAVYVVQESYEKVKEALTGIVDLERKRRDESGDMARTGWAEDKKLTEEEKRLVETLYKSREEGLKLGKSELDLIKRYENELRLAAQSAETLKRNNPFSAKVSEGFDVKAYVSSLDEVKGGYVEVMKAYDDMVKEQKALGPMAAKGIEMVTEKLEDMDEIQKSVTANAEIMASVYRQAAEMDIAEMNKKLDKTRSLMMSMRDTIGSIGDSIINTFGQAFDDFADGHLKPTVEYVKSALRDIAGMLLRMAMQKALSAALDAISNAVSPGASGTISNATMISGASALSGHAKGGVFNALEGRYPIRGYAAGGITHGPELAIIGEGRKQEAVVPLDNGQKIPVEMKNGGGARPIVVNINGAVDGESVARMLTSRRGQAALRAGVNRMMGENPELAGAPA